MIIIQKVLDHLPVGHFSDYPFFLIFTLYTLVNKDDECPKPPNKLLFCFINSEFYEIPGDGFALS